jgi:hypothetical protein
VAALEAGLLELDVLELGIAAMAVPQLQADRLPAPDPKAGQAAAGELDIVEPGQLPLGIGEVAVLEDDPLQPEEAER